MSWSLKIGPASKAEAIASLETVLPADYILNDDPAMDQVRVAKHTARRIAESVSGPFLVIELAGHANGTGYQPKAGYANDCISVRVTQLQLAHLQYHL